ncbi:MAG: methylated-DNA--[protein]-cysteine S-methyltransferase [Gammaproteobacteria bacterium]|jgi:methylated-DNA-[protein]-cysteine S-methyltransferase|nr:methylated-DNA--[protein]-cysteine S-methyltransferase [Gammaproteobacteria bacterium]
MPTRHQSPTPAPRWLSEALDAYFADPARPIDCPIEPAGTAFQRRVWARIALIPPGQTATYGALASELGSSARAVGNACRANPVPLRVPCHRVVAASGLGGFAGDRDGRLLTIKRWLLAHEGALGTEEAGRRAAPAPPCSTGGQR